jgi:hypothetical protein
MLQKTTRAFKEFIVKPRRALARQLTDNEVVECSTGTKIGIKGDYVVVDEEDRVMIIRKDRFEHNYQEAFDDSREQ